VRFYWPRAGSSAAKLLCQIPSIGPIRAALLIAILRHDIDFAPTTAMGLKRFWNRDAPHCRSFVMWMGSGNDRRSKHRFAGSTEIPISKNMFKSAATL
jgi:hypothetical protein